MARVLTFHNIPESSYDWFEKLIRFLSQITEFVDPKNFSLCSNENKILLTFDDGFLSNKYIAENILDKYNIKALFFIPVNFIDLSSNDSKKFAQKRFFPQRNIIPEDGEIMSMKWTDLENLLENGHTIGNHTFNHPQLSSIKNTDLKVKEIIESAYYLNNKLGISIDHFAYPFGGISDLDTFTIKTVSKFYKFAFTNIRGSVHKSINASLLYRQNIHPSMSFSKILLAFYGILNFKYNCDRKKLLKLAY